MPTFTLEEIVIAVLVMATFAFFILILNAEKVGGEFFYVGCEGDIEGTQCLGNPIGETNITVSSCGTGIKTVQAIDSPRCDIYNSYTQCILTSYAPVKQEEKNISVCLWDKDGFDVSGKVVHCFMNSELSCDDFTQLTTPKCGDVPGCRPVSAIKRAVEAIKPEKCTVGIGSTCLI